MSDDRIIDFNELKNKVKDTDVDKFEQYIYNLYFSVMDGSMSMSEFSRKIFDYMNDNNISQEKFMNIQKKFMERYGMDSQEVEKQLKNIQNIIKKYEKQEIVLEEIKEDEANIIFLRLTECVARGAFLKSIIYMSDYTKNC